MSDSPWKVKLWNRVTRFRRAKCNADNLLLIFPSCLQWSECPQKITVDLARCRRCGKCQVRDMIEISEEYGIQCAVATGGRLALIRVKDDSVRAIVAVACEKELKEGLKGAFPKPGIGIINLRPNGPCKDTRVNLDEVRAAIEWFLRADKETAVGSATAKPEKSGGK